MNMDDNERNQFVDDLLEASLARYSSVMPRTGLEGRVLAHARAAQERRARVMWAWWLSAGVAVIMFTVAVLNFTHRQAIPTPPKSVEVVKAVSGIGPRPVAAPPKQVRATLHASKRQIWEANLISAAEENRLPMFPSPSPMTDQEKLLVQYVRTTPAEALSATPSESEDFQKLKIEEIAITPLDAEQSGTQPK